MPTPVATLIRLRLRKDHCCTSCKVNRNACWLWSMVRVTNMFLNFSTDQVKNIDLSTAKIKMQHSRRTWFAYHLNQPSSGKWSRKVGDAVGESILLVMQVWRI